MTEPRHIPVLVREVVEALRPGPGEVLVDCTAGLGGHAAALAPALGPAGLIVLNDCDPSHLESAAERVREACPAGASPRVLTRAGNFADLPVWLGERGLAADAVLADLGFSSAQMDDGSRGLSFMREGPLDMRLDPSLPASAADLVQSMSEDELTQVIQEFGEERGARRIARKLVAERAREPISTTSRLAEIVRSAVGGRSSPGGIDPATRTFQALRIAVNDELGVLGVLLDRVSRGARSAGPGGPGSWLKTGARVVIITFHSLEDRAVKRALGALVGAGLAEDVIRGVATPSNAEVDANPRSRSAKLRAIRLAAGASAGR